MITLSKYKNTPLLGFAAYSGTGKTTLLEKLIPALRQFNIRVALIKHTHHEKFDIDKPGKDSYRLRKAGAEQVLVASAKRWALMVEHPEEYIQKHPEPELSTLLGQLKRDNIDLILVEGFKHEKISKIELHRPHLEKPLLYPHDPDIIAIASDVEQLENYYPEQIQCPTLDLNNIREIALFIQEILSITAQRV